MGIDEDSGLVVDNGEGDSLEEFFGADGTLAPTTKAIAELLHFSERDQVATARAVSALADAGVIKPWPLTMQVGDQQISVNGLHSVNEAALNALDDATFLKLRKASSMVDCLCAAAFDGAGAWTGAPDFDAAADGSGGVMP